MHSCETPCSVISHGKPRLPLAKNRKRLRCETCQLQYCVNNRQFLKTACEWSHTGFGLIWSIRLFEAKDQLKLMISSVVILSKEKK